MKTPDYYCVNCGNGYDRMEDGPDGAACINCGGRLREYGGEPVHIDYIGRIGVCVEPGKPDMVNSPAHYMHGGIETIELIKAFLTPEEFRGYLKGNIIKYMDRAPYKGQTEQDYAKALRYWEWLKGE